MAKLPLGYFMLFNCNDFILYLIFATEWPFKLSNIVNVVLGQRFRPKNDDLSLTVLRCPLTLLTMHIFYYLFNL